MRVYLVVFVLVFILALLLRLFSLCSYSTVSFIVASQVLSRKKGTKSQMTKLVQSQSIKMYYTKSIVTGPCACCKMLTVYFLYSGFSIIRLALCQLILNTGRISDLVQISERPVNLIVLHKRGHDR